MSTRTLIISETSINEFCWICRGCRWEIKTLLSLSLALRRRGKLHRTVISTTPDSNECRCTITLICRGSCQRVRIHDTFHIISLCGVFRNTTENVKKDLRPTNIAFHCPAMCVTTMPSNVHNIA